MSSRLRLRVLVVSSLVVAPLLVSALIPTAGTSVSASTFPAGLLVVGPFQPRVTSLIGSQRKAWDAADALVRAHPLDFAPVRFDPTSGKVQLTPTTARGTAWAHASSVKLMPAMSLDVAPHSMSTVPSQATLVMLMDELADVSSSGVPGADRINLTEVDATLYRAVVTTASYTSELGAYLAANFPLDLIALRVDSKDGAGAQAADARNADAKPFDGGSQIGVVQPGGAVEACTNGFPWKDASYNYMLTAGHCAPSGSTRVYTDASGQPLEGTIPSGSRENWTSTVGTVAMTGQTTVAGDFALITVSTVSAAGVEPYVFRGNAGGSTTKANVYGWNNNTPVPGDQLCTDGRQTGEMCGWVIYRANFDENYTKGVTGWARHISSAQKQGPCLIVGDSGSPLYTVNSSGVYARGILSGLGGGGSDNFGGATDPCWVYYGSLNDAYLQLPGAPYIG